MAGLFLLVSSSGNILKCSVDTAIFPGPESHMRFSESHVTHSFLSDLGISLSLGNLVAARTDMMLASNWQIANMTLHVGMERSIQN